MSTLALSEFYRLMKVQTAVRAAGYFWNLALFGFVLTHNHYWIPLWVLFFFHLFGHLVSEDRSEGSLRYQSGAAFAGFLWVSQTLALSVLIESRPLGSWWLFLGVAVTAACDIGAYVIGKTFGKHKLAPKISPGKTLEGTAGGLVFAVVTSLVVGRWLAIPWNSRILLGISLALAAAAGDLVESAWKRKMGVKDSGTMVLGHGGMLDRIDSHLFAIPTLYVYLAILR